MKCNKIIIQSKSSQNYIRGSGIDYNNMGDFWGTFRKFWGTFGGPMVVLWGPIGDILGFCVYLWGTYLGLIGVLQWTCIGT